MFEDCYTGYNSFWEKGDGRSGRMQAVIDRGLFIDSGFFSGLEAMSEMRELLDELYGSLD